MHFGIKSNIKEVERGLNDVARRQMPYAVSVAINDVLKDIKRNSEKRLRRQLDRPTPFTLKAFGIRYANKRSLTGTVFVKDAQTKYLKWAEDGGSRKPKGRAIAVPVKQRLNKYGNMPKGALKRAIAKPTVFTGAPKGRPGAPGVYQRLGKDNSKLKLLASFEPVARYKPRLGFKTGARRTAKARLPGALYRALTKAIANAR